MIKADEHHIYKDKENLKDDFNAFLTDISKQCLDQKIKGDNEDLQAKQAFKELHKKRLELHHA